MPYYHTCPCDNCIRQLNNNNSHRERSCWYIFVDNLILVICIVFVIKLIPLICIV